MGYFISTSIRDLHIYIYYFEKYLILLLRHIAVYILLNIRWIQWLNLLLVGLRY